MSGDKVDLKTSVHSSCPEGNFKLGVFHNGEIIQATSTGEKCLNISNYLSNMALVAVYTKDWHGCN